MIPGNAWAVGPAPPSAQIPIYLFPSPIILSYRQGEDVFITQPPSSPITVDVVSTGPFDAAPLFGLGTLGYGFRIELRRDGVYGALLVDTLTADIFVAPIDVEGCPSITVAADEIPIDVILSSIESCPPPVLTGAEAGVDVPFIDDV